MKVGILGAGAMGSLMGYFAKTGGADTFFIDPYEAHMKAVSENGLEISLDKGASKIIRVNMATTKAEDVGVCDVVIVLVKGMNTTKIIKSSMPLIGRDTVVMTLQNGIGNTDLLKELLPEDQIGFGLLKGSATLVGPGKIFGMSKNPGSDTGMYFYPLDPKTRLFPKFEELEALLKEGGFACELSEKTEVQVWEKLTTNIMGNIPCALIQVAPQDVVSHEMGTPLYRNIVREVCEVAAAKGIAMDFEELWQRVHVKMIPERPVQFRTFTSAIHDVSRKNPTEADFLNGAIYKEGQKLGIPTPYNETVWRLVKVLEDHYDVRYVPET